MKIPVLPALWNWRQFGSQISVNEVSESAVLWQRKPRSFSSHSFKISVYTTLSLKISAISVLCLGWNMWSQFSCSKRVKSFQLFWRSPCEAWDSWGTALILSCTHPSRAGIYSKVDRVFLAEGGQSVLVEGASLQLLGVNSRAHSEGRLLRWTLLSNLSSLKSWLLCYVWLSFWRSLSVKKSPRFFAKRSGNSAHPSIWILVICFVKNLWV